LEVSAVLTDAAAVDRLMNALEANKVLMPLTSKLRPAKKVQPTANPNSSGHFTVLSFPFELLGVG
jgi:hypothetical protein